MPKHVTEEDLAAGVRGLGGLATLQRTRRDSPFRDSRSEVKTVEPSFPAAKEASEGEAARAAAPADTAAREEKGAATEKPTRGQKKKSPLRKIDVYTEPVTLRMSPAMRDEVETMARELQRAKTSKDERITANTVMRVAVRLVLEHFSADGCGVANSEEELYRAVARALRL
jgi:hypothetical protein